MYGLAVFFNLLLSFIYAERPLLFALSLKTFIECLSIPSLLLSWGNRWLNFNFLQAYCILGEWALLEKHDIVLRNNSTLARLLTNLCLQLLTFLFITSCGVQFFELLGDPLQVLRSETFQITWANSVYFAVVTLMTVGYGDFVPYTLFGRMWIVFHIIFAAYLISREISLLIDALKSMRRGAGSYIYSSGTEHVVVTGRVKWEFLQQFVKEFLAEPSNLDTKVIVLTSNQNWSDDDWNKFVSHSPFFDHHLMFLEGSALKINDLSRARVGAAQAVFVLADPHRKDPYKEDSDILKAVLTIRNYSGAVPVYALNTLHESSFQFGIAMEHVEPFFNPEVTAGSAFPLSSTFLGLSSSHIPPRAFHHERLKRAEFHGEHYRGSFGDMVSPITGSSNDLRRDGSNRVLGASGQGLYSNEELTFAAAADANDMDNRRSARFQRSKRRAQMRKSESLCMQELETVLLAENTFCNGLSTLLANATLRVAPQSHQNDRPWLIEYKLGAECSIQQFVIRREMEGLRFERIATILQDYGLVLLAVRSDLERDWSLLTKDTVLEANMCTMALSYHDHSVIDRIADIATNFIRENHVTSGKRQRRVAGVRNPYASGSAKRVESEKFPMQGVFRPFKSDSGAVSEDEIENHVTRIIPVLETAEDKEGGSNSAKDVFHAGFDASSIVDRGQPCAVKSGTKSSMTRSLSYSTPKNPKNADGTFSKEVNNEEEGRDILYSKGRNPSEQNACPAPLKDAVKKHNRRREKVIYSSVESLPAALRGHVIVCLDGEGPLINLEFLLRRIWIRRAGQRRRAPVVVIHPRFPKNFSRRLGGHKDGLFLLQGNSLSLEILKKAQYQNARAFLIMSSESSEIGRHGSTDSKTIFTVMTLDSLLSDQDIFVCCILDAEESLQLVRAPRRARRVGVNLGQHREPDVFSYEGSATGRIPKRTTSSTSLVRSMASSPFMTSYSGYGPYRTFSGMFGPYSSGSRNNLRRGNTGLRLQLKGMSRSSTMRLDAGESSEEDEKHGSNIHKLREQHNNQQRSREELYERQRYASGEMVISSLFTALLARDYTDPGYIRLIRQLIGASSGSKGSWIRQVNIPESWTRAEVAIDGRTYRETSIRLLKLGCIALGLYRSGDAPVRVETKSEHWERRTDEFEYLEEEEVSFFRGDADSRSTGNWALNNDIYPNRRYGRTGVDSRMQEASNGTQEGMLRLRTFGDEGDEFDQLYYTCPTTKRRIFYQETMSGENVLPYVYSCPEPYSLVAASDAVFVLCDPSTEIPLDWDNV